MSLHSGIFSLPAGDIHVNEFSTAIFRNNIRNNHGVNFNALAHSPRWSETEEIRQKVIDTNMPVWPAEDSVKIIDDIIVVNFGLSN